ncbi:hypothetical protein [uncultured Pantoea sp.]|uniref:hypothetical protein n=1 Tax=uncultured Pantoea sp. TaxID=218084 RepID=UPI002584F178|nr:hypothetical protein [uncultured Pantoea sp.]
MSESRNEALKKQIEQSMHALSNISDILQLKESFTSPPSRASMPIPPLEEPIQAGPMPEPQPQGEEDTEEPASATDELQEAWLASLDQKTNELNQCLKGIQASIATLSENVEHLEAEARIKNAEADGKLADNALRKQMADRTYGFMVVWCLFIGSLIASYVIAHEGKPPTEFMLGLLGTCTISIIGLVGFVVSGLFKSPAKKDDK